MASRCSHADCSRSFDRPGAVHLVRSELRAEFPDERLLGDVEAAGEQAWAILPLVGSSGRLGALRFAYAAPQPFDEERRRFLTAVARQCAVAVERARLFEQERTATASLTLGLLPARLPGIDGLELGARSVPGSAPHAVGGDWYDAFTLPDGTVSLVVGDVMGHGLAAASGMARCAPHCGRSPSPMQSPPRC
ncbi:MAG: PP2C family protein-serine/threonine phosphatase [Jiangellaceae bacterium]